MIDFGGAAVGAVFGELLNVVLEVKNNAQMFNSSLERMEKILQSIIPIVKEIEELNKELERRKEETENLTEVIMGGKKLVLECYGIHRYDYWHKAKYAKKLVKLEESLKLFFQIVTQAQVLRGINEVLSEVRAKPSSSNAKVGGLDALCAVPEPPTNPVGFQVALGELKMELFKEGVSMVVLSAPPGCGKTTLAKLLCHDREVKEKFRDNIFYVIASKNTGMESIVRRLFKHRSYNVGEFRSDEDVVYHLEQFLKNIGPNPILLVLDDVWPDSESLLEKFRFQIADLKILVTSRSVFPGFGSTYKLKPLNNKDSLTLFCNSAFLPNQSPEIPDETVSKIVKGCKGFPLALKVVGRSLCGQPAEIWETRATELSKVGSIFEHSDLLNSLGRSLDMLDDKAIVKDCFMDLCSFPEDQWIPFNALIDMWVELYKLDQDGYAVAKLYQLSNRNLVDVVVTRSDLSRSYNQHFATQHDLLRELAIHQSGLESIEQRQRSILEINANKVPEWWMEQKPTTISSRLLSISTDEMFSSSWCSVQAPEVEVLVLNCRTRNYTLPDFLYGMKKLKVLIVMNYGFYPAEISNFPVLGCASNLRRIRLEQVSIPSFAFTSVKFQNLKKLNLSTCNIGRAFSTSTILVSESLPNLVEINIDYSNDLTELPVGICDIIKLRKLSIISCHKLVALPEEIGRLVNLEVLRLTSCIELKELPNTIGSLKKLSLLDISECSEIQRLPDEVGELQNLSELHMMGCSNECALPPSIMNLEHLREVVCDEQTAMSWEPIRQVLNSLRVKVLKEDININSIYNHHF